MSPASPTPSPLRLLALIALAAGVSGLAPYAPSAPAARRDRLKLPPIVFVSRQPVPGDPFAVPGLGPHHRAVVTGGRLMLREPDGTVRELVPGMFRDVAHPSVAPDGRRVLFSAAIDPGGLSRPMRWTPIVLNLVNGHVDTLRGGWGTNDVLQPCWITDSLFVFAMPIRDSYSEYGGVLVSQIALALGYRVDATGRVVWHSTILTSDRNGAESPGWDPGRRRILYARWWYNRWRPSDDPPGVAAESHADLDDAIVNLWQIVSIRLDGTDLRNDVSGLASRHASMGYQPAVLPDGSIVATYATNLGMSPSPVTLGIQRFKPLIGHSQRLVGAIVEEFSGYASPRGLAAPSACAPAAIPDGRVLFSYAPGGRGDFGLYVMNKDGSRIEKVFDLIGSLELDASPVAPHRTPAIDVPFPTIADRVRPGVKGWFVFHNLDVFGGSHARKGVRAAPPRTAGARIRFWRTEPLANVEGDSAILIREVPIRPDGSVEELLPADTPLFEQLIDAHGKILRTADGPAHVAGYNWGRSGETVRCIGCHIGHSTVPLPNR